MTTPRDPDEQYADALRRALSAEADAVDPRADGLMRIRDRIDARSTTMSWLRPVTAVAAVLVIAGGVAGGVALTHESGSDDSAVVVPGPTTAPPTPTEAPSATPTAAPPGSEVTVPVYYLADTGRSLRLYREFHRVPAVGDKVFDALHELFTGSADDPDYTSLWPAGTRADAVSGDTSGVEKVDLNSAALGPFNGGSEGAHLSVQQLVYTVTAADPSITQVQILVDGKRVSDLWGSEDISQPIERQTPSYEVLGAVWVLGPTQGATVGSPVEISGVATVFEGTVSIDIISRATNTRVKTTFAQASEGAPGRGTWSTTVNLPPGDYVVRAYEASAQDGHPTNIDDKAFTVR